MRFKVNENNVHENERKKMIGKRNVYEIKEKRNVYISSAPNKHASEQTVFSDVANAES